MLELIQSLSLFDSLVHHLSPPVFAKINVCIDDP